MTILDRRSKTAARLKRLSPAYARIPLVLLPTLYFVLIFWPAIGGGKTYGNRPNQQKLGIELNSYYSNLPPQAPLFARVPELLHPDYELLYQPSAREIQKAFRNGRLPLYNPHRLLGTLLWGSPVADVANPLSLLLLFCSTEHVHLIKIYVYTVLAFLGVYFSATLVFGSAPIPALIAASIYILNPFMYYMYNWASLYGVVSLVPALFCLVHLCLVRPLFWWYALAEILLAWIILVNQLQALLYFFLFLSLWLIVALLLQVYSPGLLLRRLPALGLCGAGGLGFTLGHTWYVAEAGFHLAREPHSYQAFSATWTELLPVRLLAGMWWNTAPLDFWVRDGSMVFFPIVVLGVILAAAFCARRLFSRTYGALAILLGILVIHCFVYPLHYPLYLLHVPLYNLNWEHWRVVYILYFALSIATAVSITVLTDRREMKSRGFFAVLFGAAACAYALGSLLSPTTRGGRVVLPVTAMLGLAVLSHGCWRRLSRAHVLLLGALIVAACLYLPMTRVPFYDARLDQDSEGTPSTPDSLTRTMRLIRFDEISRPNGEYLWFNDSVMAMFSRNGVTGYDTALQRNEARLFSCFYSPNLQNYRDRTSWLRYGVQSSIVWPEAEGILTVPDSLGPVNQARLQLLGISSLLWERPIGNLEPPHWDARFRLWDHSFPSSSPVSVLPDAGTPDIATLFSHAADATLADRLLRQRLAAPLYFDDKTGRYRAELPQGTGLIAVTYNLPRFYSAFLNGAAVSAEPSELPFLFIRKKSPAPAILELRPETAGIWIRTLIGLSLGCLAMAAQKWTCARANPPRRSKK